MADTSAQAPIEEPYGRHQMFRVHQGAHVSSHVQCPDAPALAQPLPSPRADEDEEDFPGGSFRYVGRRWPLLPFEEPSRDARYKIQYLMVANVLQF